MRALQHALLSWSEGNLRDLPWRATRDPWSVLVSEVMLQQTQVPRVVPAYLRFLGRFPTPAACAAASPADVVRMWAGLGYNRRALNLHRAATAITQRHGGAVPDDLVALRALPGVGAYTARAVLVFAFERDVGVVDTNVARLLARAVAGHALGPAEAQALADRLVPTGAGWQFNQALFDVGARHCQAAPTCAGCPWRRQCRWARARWPLPDPGGRAVRQTRFEGSDRQGRGRLLGGLRRGPIEEHALGAAAGWAQDPVRARRVAEQLVAEGFAEWAGGRLRLVERTR